MREKANLTEKFLGMSGIFREYDRALKLYGIYQKEKSKGKQNPRTREDLLSSLKGATETIERVHTTYSRINTEVQKEGTMAHTEDERRAYLTAISEKLKRLKEMDEELNPKPQETKEKKEEPPAPPPAAPEQPRTPTAAERISEALSKEQWQVAEGLIEEHMPAAQAEERPRLAYNLIACRINLGDARGASKAWLDHNELLSQEDSKSLRAEIKRMREK